MNIEQALFRVIDTETTGFDPVVDRIVELGACDVFADRHSADGVASGAWIQTLAQAWLCDPGIPIPAIAKAVHHIVDADVRGEPPASMRIPKLLPIGGKGIVYVAHNAPFDRGFVEANGFPTGQRWLDTYRLAMHVWPDAPSYKNEVLRYWLGYDVLPWRAADDELAAQAQHRAAHDSAVTALVLREAIKRLVDHSKVLELTDVDVLIQWADSPVVLKGLMGFGKHHDWTWQECGEKDLGYLEWIVRGNEADWDRDKYHTARHYTGRLL